MPLDQKACQNDSRTADNKQTDTNQSVEIEYLEGRKTDLSDAIGELSGMVMGALKTNIDGYSVQGDEETKTNTGYKQRLAKQSRREQNQKGKILELAARLLSVVDDKIPELQRKDAENQASYDNLLTSNSNGGIGTPVSIEDYYNYLKTQVETAEGLTISTPDDGTTQLQEKFQNTFILGTDRLAESVAALHFDVDLKTPGNTLSDQTAEIKAELQTLTDLKQAYDDVTADITTAVSNAGTAVSNSAIKEDGETVSDVLGDVNDQNLEG